MEPLGRVLIITGIIIVIAGVLLTFFGRIPLIGKLPGDIHVQRGNFHFYLPLATSLLLSIILTLVLRFLSRR